MTSKGILQMIRLSNSFSSSKETIVLVVSTVEGDHKQLLIIENLFLNHMLFKINDRKCRGHGVNKIHIEPNLQM